MSFHCRDIKWWPSFRCAQDESLDDKEALYSVFEELIKQSDFDFKQGDVVSGTVFEVDQKGAYVDIGAKSAAFCPTAEVTLCKIQRVRLCWWQCCRGNWCKLCSASLSH